MNGQEFADRRHAGRELARGLTAYAGRDDVIVLALPRGGVPVGYEVAKALGVPLDVFTVRKLGVPTHPELAMGAVATGGYSFLNERILRELRVSREELDAVIADETKELARREGLYRRGKRPLDLKDRVVIIVDDGLATGASMQAAVRAIRAAGPRRIVVGVPVAAELSRAALARQVDEVACVLTPPDFGAVGEWYADFGQTSDEEVDALLSDASL